MPVECGSCLAALECRQLRQTARTPRPTSVMTPMGTPMPIPILAPWLRPPGEGGGTVSNVEAADAPAAVGVLDPELSVEVEVEESVGFEFDPAPPICDDADEAELGVEGDDEDDDTVVGSEGSERVMDLVIITVVPP